MRRLAAILALTIAIAAFPRAQAEKLDLATIGRIKEEGLNRSQVMNHVSWLSDVYGPRLTGGPGIMQASDWVIRKFNEWGLSNPHRESWPFGKGWSLVRFSAHMIEPQVQPIIGVPASWTPGTNGTVTADVVRVHIDSDVDFEKYPWTARRQDRLDAAGSSRRDARGTDRAADDGAGLSRGSHDAGAAAIRDRARPRPPRRTRSS